jgi:molybdenum cofactor cytidylyltransferase
MIAAVVLAAGSSSRMGQPKMVLPWGETTVIGQVLQLLSQAGLAEIVVVTGSAMPKIETALKDQPARVVFNPRYAQDEMAYSLRVGLTTLSESIDAALVALGDQPQIEAQVIRSVISTYLETRAELVVPSYQMRRGHPWIVARSLWPAVFALRQGDTLRDFLNSYAGQIVYLNVDTPSVLKDLDTPEDYARERPKS